MLTETVKESTHTKFQTLIAFYDLWLHQKLTFPAANDCILRPSSEDQAENLDCVRR